MLRIRLQRRGKRNFATYRVVVAEQHAPIKGKYIADLGHYSPHTDEFTVKSDIVTNWLDNGAQPTNTVHNLLVTHKIIKADKKTSWQPKKKVGEVEEKPAENSAPETKAE